MEHVPQDGRISKYEPRVVCQARTALCVSENESEEVIETALVRQTYAGWCGGTAAFTASYPIGTFSFSPVETGGYDVLRA